MKISNSKVLIIGGSSGLGLGIAKECAINEAQVTIASRSKEKLQDSVSEIGYGAECHVVDISSETSIINLFKNVGHIDHLVVTSGFVTGKQFSELSEKDARDDFEINFWGKFNVSKYGVKYLNKGGSIIFISGAFARKPNPNVFMTSVSVAAVEAMAKTLAISLSPIRVNVISPYVIDTSLTGSGQMNEDRKEFLESTAKSLPSKCIGSPKDIGEAAMFLMSNSYVTGSILSIDGGFTVI
ncbi:MAG: SDR family oxidoreductase [Thiotrichaceae bacterium]|nr:SDR family oxidoreductase [Thiotrichaceae bacterium]